MLTDGTLVLTKLWEKQNDRSIVKRRQSNHLALGHSRIAFTYSLDSGDHHLHHLCDKGVLMTNEQIANRIPYLEMLARQYESLLTTGGMTEEEYKLSIKEINDEIDILEEMAEENKRRERFDQMMGNPLKALGELFK